MGLQYCLVVICSPCMCMEMYDGHFFRWCGGKPFTPCNIREADKSGHTVGFSSRYFAVVAYTRVYLQILSTNCAHPGGSPPSRAWRLRRPKISDRTSASQITSPTRLRCILLALLLPFARCLLRSLPHLLLQVLHLLAARS